jgi:hypothetical protein
VAAMRSLLAAAVAVAAAAVHSLAGGPHVETIFSHGNTTISAFAQDGALVAWFSPSRGRCNMVHVISLANPLQTTLPLQGSARNVTCRWVVGSTPVSLALAGGNVLWTLREQSPIPFDYLLGAGVGASERKERRFQEIAHTNHGSGLWLGGTSGDGATLVYGVTAIDYVDEAGCLAGTSPCDLEVSGGGVYRMSGREAPKLIPGTESGGAVEVAASADAVAYVPAADVGKQGRPLAGADLPIEIVDAQTGGSISRVSPQGTPIAITLAPHILATLERTPLGLRLAWYDRATGSPEGSVPVSGKTIPKLTATDRTIVYHVRRSIRAVDVETHNVRTLAQAASEPVGLSLEGRRLAWAENLKTAARIRALTVKP